MSGFETLAQVYREATFAIILYSPLFTAPHDDESDTSGRGLKQARVSSQIRKHSYGAKHREPNVNPNCPAIRDGCGRIGQIESKQHRDNEQNRCRSSSQSVAK